MDPRLLIALVVGIALIVVVVLKTRLDAFVALLISAVTVGLIAGQPLLGIVDSITKGFGTTLGNIGMVIGLGVGLGKILEVSGAAAAIAQGFLKLFGKGRESWAMTSIGALISIPVFCDSGYVIMNPLARSVARLKKAGYATLGIALAGGMVITHHLVPPTPGPLGVAGILGVDVGAVIILGLIMTVGLIPVVTLYANWIGPKVESEIEENVRQAVYVGTTGGSTSATGSVATATSGGDVHDEEAAHADNSARIASGEAADPRLVGPSGERGRRIGAFMGLMPLVLPLVLIVANTVVTAIDKTAQGNPPAKDYEPAAWAAPFAFIGHPVLALLIGLVLAVYVLLPRWTPQKLSHTWLAEAAADAGLILLITGAGGGLGQVLRDSGIGDALAGAVGALPLPTFLLPFVIASIVRIAQGSGTVSMITAASVTAPVMATLGVNPLVAVMACVSGAMVCSYYNDSYFWVVTRFLGLDGTAALKAHSGLTTVMWVASIPMLFIADLVL